MDVIGAGSLGVWRQKYSEDFFLLVEGLLTLAVGTAGIFLNLLSIFFFIRQRTQRTFHRLLVLLALSDTVHIICSLLSFSIPTISSEYDNKIYQYSLPFTLPIAQTTIVISVYLTISLSLERYISVVYPLLSFRTRTTRAFLCLSIPSVLFSVLFTLPNYFVINTEKRSPEKILEKGTSSFNKPKDNKILWADFRNNEAYITVYVLWLHLIFITIIPFILLLCLNKVIYNKLSETRLTALRRSSENIVRKREMRMARISILIVIIFLFCHTPKMVPSICEIITNDAGLIPGMVEVSHLLLIINGSVNFLIYSCSSGTNIIDLIFRRGRQASGTTQVSPTNSRTNIAGTTCYSQIQISCLRSPSIEETMNL